MTDPEVDPATGMPVVPEGYFWRVRRIDGIFTSLVKVDLRKKWLVGSFSVRESNNFPNLYDSVEKTVLQSAKNIMRELTEDIQIDIGFARVVGDYPPKKLEAE